MEKILEKIKEAEKKIKTIDHITYVTFPLIKEKKLLLKIVLETKKAISNCINSILQYEYVYKRIRLHKNPKKNFETFAEKCAKRYNITKEEIESINELFQIVEEYRKSSFEFMKDEKIILLFENSRHKTITHEKIKEFLRLSKKILIKTKKGILM